jgi:3-isopropylmalate/(R)-2-methylmalate dehydratase small subunit
LLQEWTSTYYTNSDIVDILFEFQGEIEINLEKQSVKADNKAYHFDVDSERKRRLINGLDDIDLTLQYEDKIRSFEAQHLNKYPWL